METKGKDASGPRTTEIHNCFFVFLHRFWLAVEDLKKRPMREVPNRVQEIWQEFLAPGAPSAINLDSKSYDKTTQNVKEPGRYTFDDAQVSRTSLRRPVQIHRRLWYI